MANDAKPPDRKVNRRTSYSNAHKDTPEPFPSYIEPTHFDAATMDAEGPLGMENVRNLSTKDRQALLEGELKLQLYIGGTWICSMPWRLFQSLSTKASEVSDADPKVRQMHLPAGLSKMPFLYILVWLKEITTSSPFHLLKRRDDVSEDISICRAARLLGMTEYTQHIFNHYWALFNNTMPNLEDIGAVEQLAATEEKLGLARCDGAAFLECIVRRLAHAVVNKELSDSVALASFLQEHPKILERISKLVNPATAAGSQGNRQNTSNPSPLTRPTTGSPKQTTPVQDGDVEQSRGLFAQPAPWDLPTQPLSAATGAGASRKFPSRDPTGISSTPPMFGRAVNTTPAFPPISEYKTASCSDRSNDRITDAETEYKSYLPYGNLRTLPSYISTDAVLKDANQERYTMNSALTPLDKNPDAIPMPPSFGRRNNLFGQYPPRSSMNDDDIDTQTPPHSMNFGSFNARLESVGQPSASQIGIKPFPASTDSPLLAMAKKMFPPPTDKTDMYRQASQHATALLEQNAHFREERFRAAVQTNFKFSNDTWSLGHAPVFQEEPQLDRQPSSDRTNT